MSDYEKKRPRDGAAAARPPRSGRFGKGDGPKKMKFPRLSDEIMALDADMLKMLQKRDQLMRKIRGGKKYSDKPGMVESEKDVRRAWEEAAGKISRDPRLIRQFYALMQEIEFSGRPEGDTLHAFNLAPARQPVRLHLPAPALAAHASAWLVLAALLGKTLRVDRVQKSREMNDLTTALMQAGASVTWGSEQGDPYVQVTGTLDAWNDKAVFVGESLLAFCLLAFSRVSHVGQWRFTGAQNLKEYDLSALQRFFPTLGARLAFVMPHSKGLPAILECSGEVPDSIDLPADLPGQAVLGILLASLSWGKPVRIALGNLSGETVHGVFEVLSDVFARLPLCGGLGPGEASIAGTQDLPLIFPERIACAADPIASAYLLALPYFSGGISSLSGRFPDTFQYNTVAEFFLVLGLTLERGEDSLKSSGQKTAVGFAPRFAPERLPKELHPLFWAVCGKLTRQNKTAFTLPAWPEDADVAVAADFLAQMGVLLRHDEQNGGALSLSLMEEAEAGSVAAKQGGWSSPSPWWTLGMALAAFCRANMRLSNPDGANDVIPGFWHLYNSLPEPRLQVDAPVPEVAPECEEPEERRRRIRTAQVATLRPLVELPEEKE